jgi:putative hydrolase of the HAD superfamily
VALISMKTLVLDAMGVIYAVGDDVGELLCPFIHENDGLTDDRKIEAIYLDASLGRFSAREFWERVEIDPALEDAYLLRHQLSDGLLEFLSQAQSRFTSIWCLSNDVSEWSRKLRERFGLSQYIDGFVISGDVGIRKPDAAIYERLLERTNMKASDIIFIDDRIRNLDAAAGLGFETVLFGAAEGISERHKSVANFSKLFDCLNRHE